MDLDLFHFTKKCLHSLSLKQLITFAPVNIDDSSGNLPIYVHAISKQSYTGVSLLFPAKPNSHSTLNRLMSCLKDSRFLIVRLLILCNQTTTSLNWESATPSNEVPAVGSTWQPLTNHMLGSLGKYWPCTQV